MPHPPLLPRWRTAGLPAVTLCATFGLFVLPACLFVSRAFSDIIACVIGALFLLYSSLAGDWQWLRKPWVGPAALFCGWCVLSSIVAQNSAAIVQALCLPRLFLLTAAAQNWLLARNKNRLILGGVFLALVAVLLSQCWQQYFTGSNSLGAPPWPDGVLTGPFVKPRASFTLLMLFFPGVMPLVLYAFRHKGYGYSLAGMLLLSFCAVTMVIIGQRMSTILMFFGLFLTAVLIPRFRKPFLDLAVGMSVLLVSLPAFAPAAYAKLVVKFSYQMQNFAETDYGELFKKASIMVLNHPLFGEGVDGFRNSCHLGMSSTALAYVGLPLLASPAGVGCNIHPHNYYLQVATTAGLPGLFFFCTTVFLWLTEGARRLSPYQNPQQAMLFVMCCTVLWPVASTSSLFTFPTAGWIFVSAGWLLAASAANAKAPKTATLKDISS